jgi:hypothetical protein
MLLGLSEESSINNILSLGEAMNTNKMSKVLVVGSCLWDKINSEEIIQGRTYKDHGEHVMSISIVSNRDIPTLP